MSANRKLVLVGCGETARIAHEYFTWDSPYDVVAFSAERGHLPSSRIAGLPVVPFEDLVAHYAPEHHDVFVAASATGLNRLRARLYLAAKAMGYRCASYVSSRAFVWRNATIGENCFIFEHNTIQPFVEIGDDVILWSGNHVGHHSVIHEHCFISSHVVISGYCTIGASSFVGVNATFNDGVHLPADSLVGSGSLLLKSPEEPGRIYVGSPARAIPDRSSLDADV